MGMKITFYRHKCKNWKCDPANTGQPFLRRKKCCPKVIHQHEQHCNAAVLISKHRDVDDFIF